MPGLLTASVVSLPAGYALMRVLTRLSKPGTLRHRLKRLAFAWEYNDEIKTRLAAEMEVRWNLRTRSVYPRREKWKVCAHFQILTHLHQISFSQGL
jgi:hypothetical protein